MFNPPNKKFITIIHFHYYFSLSLNFSTQVKTHFILLYGKVCALYELYKQVCILFKTLLNLMYRRYVQQHNLFNTSNFIPL